MNKEPVDMTGYRLVWSDEFEGDHIDHTKWGFGAENTNQYLEMPLVMEDESPKTVSVRNGQLQMNANMVAGCNHPMLKENPHIKFVTNRAVSTKYTMNFKYGYVEMRAKVPFKKGGFPAFWSLGKPGLVERKNKNYYTEVDYFESFSSASLMSPGMHKWYADGTHTCPRNEQQPGYGKYTFKNPENICNEYHVYGFEWTPTEMRMFFDGECYCKYDITFCYDADWTQGNMLGGDKEFTLPHDDMDGFHDYMYLLLQNLIFVPGKKHECDDWAADDPSLFPYEYWVDYVRLYQKPGVGELVSLQRVFNK